MNRSKNLQTEIVTRIAERVVARWRSPDARKTSANPAGSQHGRTASAPTGIPWAGLKDIGWRVIEGVQRDRVLLVAAGVAFYALLALFPATGSVVSVYGLFADPSTINKQLSSLSGFLPEGALTVLGDQIKLINQKSSTANGLTFVSGLLISIWGANAGTKSIFDALNIIYKEDEKRSFLQLNFQSLLFTLGAVVLLSIAAASVVFVPAILTAVGFSGDFGTRLLLMARWPLLMVVIMFGLACLYRFGPSRMKPQWKWVTPGSFAAAVVWLSGSLLFSYYVSNFGNYNATYGSLGAIIGFISWLWLSALMVLLGAEINAEFEHQTAVDTADNRPADKPLGLRGATMADHVARSTDK